MADRAATGPLDGIVVVELSLDERWEIPSVVGCLRAGAAALEHLPVAATDTNEMLSRREYASHARRVADEIDAEARKVHAAREVEHRRRAKVKR